MINQNFDILAAILALIGAANYAWYTFKGKAQPNRVSWLLWTITPSISFAAELVQHVHLEVTLLTLSEALGPFLVVTASFASRKAFWKASPFDWSCGAVSVLALVLWLVTGKGDVALIFSLAASLFSSIPTITKSYAHPTTESPWDYLASFVAGGITLMTIQQWTLGNYGFPVYITLESAVISFLVLTPWRVHEPAAAASVPAVTPTEPLAETTHATESGAVSPSVENAAEPQQLALGVPQWSQNPVPQSGSAILSVAILSHGPGIAQAEYVGSVDPGVGRGFPMAIDEDTITATFHSTVPKGPYPIRVRAKDITNTWTDLQPTILTVV